MNLFIIIIQFLFAIPLIVSLNLLEKNKINSVNLILWPTVYMILIAALFEPLKVNIFLIPVVGILGNYFVNNFMKENPSKQTKDIIEVFLSLIISIFTYIEIINKLSNLLPTPGQLLPWIWTLIFIYLYKIAISLPKFNFSFEKINEKEINDSYFITNFVKFKNSYANLFTKQDNKYQNFITTILVYQNYLNPKPKRVIKEWLNPITHNNIWGIAQIKSLSKLTDKESVTSLIEIVKKTVKTEKITVLNKTNKTKILKKLNNNESFINNILTIEELIMAFFKN